MARPDAAWQVWHRLVSSSSAPARRREPDEPGADSREHLHIRRRGPATAPPPICSGSRLLKQVRTSSPADRPRKKTRGILSKRWWLYIILGVGVVDPLGWPLRAGRSYLHARSPYASPKAHASSIARGCFSSIKATADLECGLQRNGQDLTDPCASVSSKALWCWPSALGRASWVLHRRYESIDWRELNAHVVRELCCLMVLRSGISLSFH